jgi:glutathione S-transferase
MTIVLHELVGADEARPFSPHCWKVVMALAHKGLPFERKPVCFTGVPGVEGGVSKTVPVIRDGSQVVADSFMIAAYLEETYPDRPSLFGGDGGQAMARFVESWSQSTLHAALNIIALKEIHDRLAPEDQAYFMPSREARLGKTFEQVAEQRDAEIAGLFRQADAVAGHAEIAALDRRIVTAVCRLHRLRGVAVGPGGFHRPIAGGR